MSPPQTSEHTRAKGNFIVKKANNEQVEINTRKEILTRQAGYNEFKKGPPMQTAFASADIISVVVGKTQTEFGLHKSFLIENCPFFEKCLGAGMKETMDGTVSLPDDDPQAFNIVAEWIYGSGVGLVYTPLILVRAYILADKLCMPMLQNAIADLLRLRKPLPDPEAAASIWNNLPDGSPLRQLILDQTHYLMIAFPEYEPGMPNVDAEKALRAKNMMRDAPELTAALYWKSVDHGRKDGSRNLVDPSTVRGVGGCHYHVHENGKNCNY